MKTIANREKKKNEKKEEEEADKERTLGEEVS